MNSIATSLLALVLSQAVLAPPCHATELFDPLTTRTMRSSSSDPAWQAGNGDARQIPAGQTIELANLTGPGVIRHLWFTVASSDLFYPRSLVIRIYWDGSSQPAVESPLGDFFAVGHGLRRALDSDMVAVSSEGRSYNCYWPMPFRNNARITITNDGSKEAIFYYYVDYEANANLTPETRYFHAQYRQEIPPPQGQRYTVLDTQGEGHYVGTVLSSVNRMFSWHGEGDDFFFIDGEAEPSIRGTGTEDYFGDAWGFREFNNRLYGVPVYDGQAPGDRTTAYRWHTDVPIAFESALRFEIEHTGLVQQPGGAMGGYGERPDEMSSVAFWYQTGTATDFAELPPISERVPQHVLIEGESLLASAIATAGTPVAQDIGTFSGGKQLFFNTSVQGSRLVLPITAPGTGRYRVAIVTMLARDFGTYDITLGTRTRRGVNFYHPLFGITEYDLGVFKLTSGQTVNLTFHNVGVDYRSEFMESATPAFHLGLDAIIFYPLPSRFYSQSPPATSQMSVY